MMRLKKLIRFLGTVLVPTLLLLALAVTMFYAGYTQGQHDAEAQKSQTITKEGE